MVISGFCGIVQVYVGNVVLVMLTEKVTGRGCIAGMSTSTVLGGGVAIRGACFSVSLLVIKTIPGVMVIEIRWRLVNRKLSVGVCAHVLQQRELLRTEWLGVHRLAFDAPHAQELGHHRRLDEVGDYEGRYDAQEYLVLQGALFG